MCKGTHSTQPQLQGNKALRDRDGSRVGWELCLHQAKELEALGLMALGQQGRKSASGVGKKKIKSYFSSEAVSFVQLFLLSSQ